MAIQTLNLLLRTNNLFRTNNLLISNNLVQQPTPTLSPVAGSYIFAQTVAVTSTLADAIYYTTDGSTPTTSSTLYSGPISVAATETLKAIAVRANYSNSAVATADYTIGVGFLATYPMNEGSGGILHNTVNAPTTTPTLFACAPEQNFTFAWQGATATDDIAVGPDGVNINASRIQASAGSYAFQATSLAAGQYTISVYVKSNTGSADAFEFAYTDTFGLHRSPSQATTTSWARYSWTFTGAHGTITNIGLAAAGTSDNLYYGIQLEAGAVATTYTPQTLDQQLSGPFMVNHSDGTPTWESSGLLFAGREYTVGELSTPIIMTQGSFYAAVKISGSDFLSGYEPVVMSNATDSTTLMSLVAATNVGATGSSHAGFNFGGVVVQTSEVFLKDSNWHLLAGTCDGTTTTFYVDGAIVGKATGVVTPFTLYDLWISCLLQSGPKIPIASFPGHIGYVAAFTTGHTAAQVAEVNQSIYTAMLTKGVTMGNSPNFVAFEGDSITDPLAWSWPTYPWLTVTAISPSIPSAINFSVTGSTLATAMARAAVTDSYLTNSSIRTNNILTVFFGANDLGSFDVAGFESNLQNYCQARQVAGWKVIVSTVLPRTLAGFNAARDAANTWIRANYTNFANGLADVASNATMGPDAAASNVTYYTDGEHPTALGQTLLAPYFTAAINAIA